MDTLSLLLGVEAFRGSGFLSGEEKAARRGLTPSIKNG